jgi:hypothetical protein
MSDQHPTDRCPPAGPAAPASSPIQRVDSRRTFIRKGLLASSGLALGGNAAVGAAPQAAVKPADDSPCLDYGRSFLCNTAAFNSVRMWIESRTRIIDHQLGTSTDYYQGASCKSENTFSEKDLFHQDNYDFLPIFGDGKVLVFRRHHHQRADRYRSIRKMEEMWGNNPLIHTPAPKVITALDTWEKIRDATAAGAPIVTRTEIHNAAAGLSAIIECPCKTMNISHTKRMYQVDTGPVAFPDLSRRHEVQIGCLSLAYLAFNSPHSTDFVIEAPTPILEGGKTVATVHHYSRIVSMSAVNRVFALGG